MSQENNTIDRLTIDELFHRSLRHRGSIAFMKFFNFIAGFSHYSRFNTMLVYLQNETVTFFGGTSFWKKKFKRTIRENARPYVIMAPGGPVMMVYDIFDTEGNETPEGFLEKGLGTKHFEVKGIINREILQHAENTAHNWGIKITPRPLSYFNSGYITTIFSGKLEIALKEGRSPEENISVLIHELAHLFLGHTGHTELINPSNSKKIKLLIRKLERSVEELEAETVSFLVCKKIGLETKAAEYIAAYIKDERDLEKFSYETVIKVADKIDEMFIQKYFEKKIIITK